jgi:hypothetical protein
MLKSILSKNTGIKTIMRRTHGQNGFEVFTSLNFQQTIPEIKKRRQT